MKFPNNESGWGNIPENRFSRFSARLYVVCGAACVAFMLYRNHKLKIMKETGELETTHWDRLPTYTKYLSMINFGSNYKGEVDEDATVKVIRFKDFKKETYDVRRGDLNYKSVKDIAAEHEAKKKAEAESKWE